MNYVSDGGGACDSWAGSDLQEVLELAGCVDKIRQAAVNLGVVARGGSLHEQLGAVVLRRK